MVLQIIVLVMLVCESTFSYTKFYMQSMLYPFICLYGMLCFISQARLFSMVYRVKHESLWVFGVAYAISTLTTILFLTNLAFFEWYKDWDGDGLSHQGTISDSVVTGAIVIILATTIVLLRKLYDSNEINK